MTTQRTAVEQTNGEAELEMKIYQKSLWHSANGSVHTFISGIEKDFPYSGFHMQICSGFWTPLQRATVIRSSIQDFSLTWTIIFHLLMTWLSGLSHLQNALCLFLLIILYFFYFSFLIDHEGMSALDDKMSHLKQDTTLYRRQHDKKRGDDVV